MDLYLIDGNSYVYRAFFAIRGLTDSSGRPTNAVFGFTNMLLKIMREREPGAVICAFDTPHPTARHELFEDYKAHRPDTPDDLISQMPLVKDMVRAFGIPLFEVPGYEADDVLATLAERGAKEGMNVYIVTSDKDMLQLVGGPVKVYDPMKDIEYDEAAVEERFSVPPSRVVEYMALVGDASDNIPGVKGVGEKTAKALLAQFKSLEDLMEHADTIEKPRLKKLISEGVENIKLSRQLAEIQKDVPLEDAEGALRPPAPDNEKLFGMFRDLGFTSLMKLIPGESAPAAKPAECRAVLDLDTLGSVLSAVKDAVAFDTEATGRDAMRDALVGFSLFTGEGTADYVPLSHRYIGAPEQVNPAQAMDALRPVMEDESVAKVGHNLKFDILMLRKEGVEVRGPLHDTMIASYLLTPQKAAHSLEAAALEHLGRKKTPFKEVAGKDTFDMVELDRATPYAAQDAELAWGLRDVLFPRLREEGLEEIYLTMEMPLISVLARMEAVGMKLDVEKFSDVSKELERGLDSIGQRIFFLAGEEFNINSPKQLAKVLFENMGLKPGKKKKTGYSTDQSVLEELAREHELPQEILNWRSLSKLKNTYADVLPRLINPATGRLHTSFNQTVTATGRLSSSDPNLQNIPIRGEWGPRIREAFVADEGSVIISADYSQIELRILAHLSEDETLVDAFLNDIDVHSRTASEIFDVPLEEVTSEQRRVAKTVNFGVIYGQTPFGLSASLGIPRWEAEQYITNYFVRHPGVQSYQTDVLARATREGYVQTMFGRKRPLPELQSKAHNMRQLGERMAVNTPIQGTAADIIKLAMIRLDRMLEKKGLATRMLLQVHDELVLEAPRGEAEQASALIREAMEEAAELRVPLKVDLGTGANWAEAH